MSEDLLGVVRDLVAFKHAKGDDAADHVLNRVFEKAVRLTLGDPTVEVPGLNRKNTSVAIEDRSIADMALLATREPRDLSNSPYPVGSVKRFKRRVRKGAHIPVVVVNYEGRDYLIDGNRRVNYWTVKGGAETMQVYVVTVR